MNVDIPPFEQDGRCWADHPPVKNAKAASKDGFATREAALEAHKEAIKKTIKPFYVVSLKQLSEMEFTDNIHLIRDILSVGLNLIASDPKLGKSILVMCWCVHIAYGVPYWGRETQQGRCLYLALEDNYRRAWSRLSRMLPYAKDFADVPFDLTLRAEKIGNGLEQQIEHYATQHADTKVVAIDVLADVENQDVDTRGMTAYQADRKKFELWRNLSEKYPNIAIILVHHTRKAESGSSVHAISGSQGIASSVDNMIILRGDKADKNIAHVEIKSREMFCDDKYPESFVIKRGDRERREWHYVGEKPTETKNIPTEPTSKQAEANMWCKELFDSRLWIESSEYKTLGSAKGYGATELQRARTANGYKTSKNKKIFYIDGEEPSNDELEKYANNRLVQTEIEWQPTNEPHPFT